MKKKVLSLALALALCLGLAAPALAAGKLSTPTDLAWGGEGEPVDTMSWRFGENTMGYVHLVIYKDGRQLSQTWGGYGVGASDYPGTEQLGRFLAMDDLTLESGTYHFTVQNVMGFESTSSNNSAVATSPKWTYTKPAAQLAAPSAPAWDFPYCTWRSGNVEGGDTVILFYFSKTQSGKYAFVSSCSTFDSSVPKTAVDTWALEKYGAGYYKFRVMNLSNDVTQTQNSPWSPYSEPYYYDGSPVDICEHLNWDRQGWKEATCTEAGYTGNWVCTDCGEVMEYGEVIPATGHNIGSDGWCYYCGEQIEYHGTLGDSSELSWTYSAETGELAFSGGIPSGETVFVACYRNGRFTGVKTAAGSNATVNVGTAWDQLRLFWLDGSQVPQCRAGSLSPEP